MRRFQLFRKVDVSGVSGTGAVADGIQFRDGVAVLHWNTAITSTAIYASIEALMRIHGHDGCTSLVWVDLPLSDLTDLSFSE